MWKIFMDLSWKALLNSGHRFCGLELKHTELFLRLSRHFTATSAVVVLEAIGIMYLLPHATKNSWNFPSNDVSFISVCCLAFVKYLKLLRLFYVLHIFKMFNRNRKALKILLSYLYMNDRFHRKVACTCTYLGIISCCRLV
jgi:hypothetical protein